LRQQRNPDASQLAYAYNHLGNLFTKTHEFDKAIEQHLQAIDIRKKLKDKKLLADSYNNLGVIYHERNELEESAKYMYLALALYEKEYHEFHPFIGIVKNNLSKIEESFNYDFVKAENLLLSSYHIFVKAYGPEHNNTLTLQSNIIAFYNRRMRYQDAIDFYYENIDALLASHKTNKIVNHMSTIGMIFAKNNEFKKSTKNHLDSLELAAKSPLTLQYLFEKLNTRFARSLIIQSEFKQANSYLSKALEYNQKNHPSDNVFGLYIVNLKAYLAYKEKKYNEAKNYYLQILKHKKTETLYVVEYIDATIGLAKIYRQSHEYNQSENALNNAEQQLISIKRENHKTMAIVYYQQAMLYQAQKQDDKAEKMLQKALLMQVKILPPQHPDLIATKKALKDF